MENQFFLTAGVPTRQVHFEPSPPQSMATWQSLPSEQTQDCFYNRTWEKSKDHNGVQFDSALVSSPAASNDNLVIKLGNIGGGAINTSDEISLHNSQAAFAVAAASSSSCHSTPMSSPPKVTGMSHVAEFSADPGFAERAAKFSCFGSSTSFNGRSSQLGMNNAAENAMLPKVLGSQKGTTQSTDLLEVTNSRGESTISGQTPNGVKPYASSRKRKASSSSKGKGAKETSTPPMGAGGSKRCEGEGNENGSATAEEESKEGTSDETPAEPPKDYIHVRARRGQATDSHSLAERVRREKISERMKLLQDLVPGCNKVTGKALMLEEIINYVQSLQRQVEFLSMKLSSVNTRLDFSIESLVSKDIFQSNNCLAHPIFQLDSSSPAYYGQHPIPQQNSAIHNNIPNGTVTHHCSVDPSDTGLGMQLPPLNAFNNNNEGGSQYPMTFSEDDLHAIVQMGFGQAAKSKTPLQSQSFSGSNQVPL